VVGGGVVRGGAKKRELKVGRGEEKKNGEDMIFFANFTP